MNTDKGFEIDFLPVGKETKGGDAILFRFGNLLAKIPQQQVVVVDGGYQIDGKEIIRFVKEVYKTDTIDLVILTHPDQDHVSGLRELFKDDELTIKKLIMHRPWVNNKINTSYFKDGRLTENSLNKKLAEAFKLAYELETLANEKGTEIVEPILGKAYFGGILKIVGPNLDFYRNCLIDSDKTPEAKNQFLNGISKLFNKIKNYLYENYVKGKITWYDNETTNLINETSVVSYIDYEGIKILLTGDTGKQGLQNVFDYMDEKDIDLKNLKIFQVPHHGSRKNVNKQLLKSFKADFCIISCPKEGEPKHPSKRLINLMNELGHKVYVTQGCNLHWGINCPQRNGVNANAKTSFEKIETNEQ